MPAAAARGVASREAMAKELEKSQEIRFEVLTNDGDMRRLEQLCTLKNIFAAQLPKMPRDYISRLVFDRRHVSLAILRDDAVLGGICYRPFRAQRFAEIAFCAITASEQVRGFGTRVMNHLKEHAKRSGILYFLTYADNYAIGYFKKQGFSANVGLPREKWFGFIKDYDGGTLMECYIHPTIDFLNVREMVRSQRSFVEARLVDRFEATEPRRLIDPTVDLTDNTVSLLDHVPGLRELGYTEAQLRALVGSDRAENERRAEERQAMSALLEKTKRHEASWPFLEPVDVVDVPDYLDVISDPIDLKTIHDHLKSTSRYRHFTHLKADILRMLDNCRKYNVSGLYVKTADTLEKYVLNEARKLEEHLARCVPHPDGLS
ncbi:hypothetical protein CTAYLR_004762 [Chrysophaeum taylorii]|uniref:histone acetyltransferase n=1 Tax=Chrysophaeum taylorii TaxID=2483200 RepID=A0AAD7U7P7_9STRA|nr:hypothetical protein CTAYLR_004762 [Chrysophaeum taylorii]